MVFFNKNKLLESWKGCAHLFLDEPYRCGYSHIKQAFKKSEKTSEIIQAKLAVESEKSEFVFKERNIPLKERVFHLVIGIIECIPIVNIIVAFVEKYFHSEKGVYRNLDKHQLISSKGAIEPHKHSWYLNLALLRSAYEAAKGVQKEQIKFLAANFLNKIAPKHTNWWIDNLREIDSGYSTLQQESPFGEYTYHRECLDQRCLFGKKFNQNLAYGEKSLFLLTDTTEIDHLLSLKFTVVKDKSTIESYASIIKGILHEHFSKDPEEALHRQLSHPFLIDVTHILDKNIQTNNRKEDEKEFVDCFEKFKKDFAVAQEKAIEQLVHENPHLLKFKSKIEQHLKDNVTCVSRVKMEGSNGIKMLPMESSSDVDSQFKSPLIHYLITTGLYIGAINLRRLVSDVFQQRSDITYSVSEKLKSKSSALVYPEKKDFTGAHLFQRLLCLFGSKAVPSDSSCGIALDQMHKRIESISKKPHMIVLGKATVDLLQGLMSEIKQEKWDELNKDPILSQVFQTSLFLIREHLAMAELYAMENKFSKFAQEIELIHAELATILELTHPFDEEDFGKIYKKELIGKSVPVEMEKGLKVGLGKAAVNVFAGIVAAAKKTDIPLQGVFSQGAYFEQTILMNHYFDNYISDPSLPKLDIYHGQFNCNIDVGSKLTEYKRRDIAADVRKLLDEDRVSKDFTVAVDITIDEFYSSNVKKLLMEFQDEIKAGKLNFVFFTSGQKFYTMGMDNYYGSPFYLVNNGEEKWKAFDSLLTHPSYRTDSLSAQWFSLSTKYASDALSNYRKLIFSNTRAILDGIPKSLQPNAAPDQKYKVNKANADMDPCFIDMKVVSPPDEQFSKCCDVKKSFFKMLLKKEIEGYARGSFGFYHCNFAIFGHLDDSVRTIRINPGLNPEDNEGIIEFFESLSK